MTADAASVASVAGDAGSFQEVKLLEFPYDDTYAIAFVVAESPRAVAPALEADVETLVVPLAPNPVMGGFLVHAPRRSVRDVDMTVEEAFGALVSLGTTEVGEAPARATRFQGP